MSELHVNDINGVEITDQGYWVNDEFFVDETDVALLIYLENGGVTFENAPEEIDPADMIQQHLQDVAQQGVHRRAIIAVIQEEALTFGLDKQMMAIFNYADEHIEAWKYSGDAVTLDTALTASESTRLRAALDKVISDSGTTVQQYMLTRIGQLTNA